MLIPKVSLYDCWWHEQVNHKRTFLYLEQLILKHGMHRGASSLKEVHDGIDFYFSNKNTAVKLNEFLQANIPVRSVPSPCSRPVREDALLML